MGERIASVLDGVKRVSTFMKTVFANIRDNGFGSIDVGRKLYIRGNNEVSCHSISLITGRLR